MGYCAKTGARKSWLAVVGRFAAIDEVILSRSGPPGRRCREPGGFGRAEYPIHPLHGAARRALVEVINNAHDGNRSAVRHGRKVGIVAGGNFLHARRVLAHPYERTVRIE